MVGFQASNAHVILNYACIYVNQLLTYAQFQASSFYVLTTLCFTQTGSNSLLVLAPANTLGSNENKYFSLKSCYLSEQIFYFTIYNQGHFQINKYRFKGLGFRVQPAFFVALVLLTIPLCPSHLIVVILTKLTCSDTYGFNIYARGRIHQAVHRYIRYLQKLGLLLPQDNEDINPSGFHRLAHLMLRRTYLMHNIFLVKKSRMHHILYSVLRFSSP